MTIVLDITPEVQVELARQAAAHGRAIEAHAVSLLEQAVHLPGSTREPVFDKGRAQAAAARIRELSRDLVLGDLTIRELIDEGRR